MQMLYAAALGAAMHDLRRGVREMRENWSKEIEHMLRNAGITVPAPWCAAAVQDWSDSGALALGVKNPLDTVKLQAYVPSYVEWARENGKLCKVEDAQPGMIVAYKFGKRYDHIGMVLTPPKYVMTQFESIEGNTNEDGQREGVKVLQKRRTAYGDGKVVFIAWAS